MKRRALNIFIALDQLVWVLLTLGHANPDETLSAGLWRMEQAGRWQGRWLRPVVDALFFFDPDHCRKAFYAERRGHQNHAIYRSRP